MLINIISFDPSFRNWGIALATYNTEDQSLNVHNGYVIQHNPKKTKTDKQNTLDLQTASYLATHLFKEDIGNSVLIAEVPHGSQSSRAMVSYGVCIGLLGSLIQDKQSLIQVGAMDVKRIVEPDRSVKEVPKEQVIQWVKDRHPEILEWLPKTKKQEHICDAIVAIYAGMQTLKFKDIIQ